MRSSQHKVASRYRLFLAMSLEDAAKILEVSPNASQDEINKAYRRKALENHPDRGGSHEKMVEVNVAKEVLEGKQAPERETPSYQAPTQPRGPLEVIEDKVSLEEALNSVSIPSGVEWVFKTSASYGGYADTSKMGVVFYGKTDNAHVFVGLYQHVMREMQGSALFEFDHWYAWVDTSPNSQPLAKVAPGAIRDLWGHFEGVKGYGAKVVLLDGVKKLDHKALQYRGREVSFKDAMDLLGTSEGAFTGRKISVVFEIQRLDGYGAYGQPPEPKNLLSLIVNGREYKLQEQSVNWILKSGALKLIFGAYPNPDMKKDLTRVKGAKKVLLGLSEKLTHEPEALREALKAASDQAK